MSYHNVVVTVSGVEYKIAEDYSVELSCNRVSGWQLWRIVSEHPDWELVGGEYSGADFRIQVAGLTICDSKQEKTNQ